MNQSLLTRLFKPMEGEKNTPFVKVAFSIIEDENRKGHIRLANKLSSILQDKIQNYNNLAPSFKIAKDGSYKMPVDRRYRLPLATHIEHENLRHEMVLDKNIESKLLRIEKEYLA